MWPSSDADLTAMLQRVVWDGMSQSEELSLPTHSTNALWSRLTEEVHVWRAHLDLPAVTLQDLKSAKGAPARHQAENELRSSWGGAPDTAAVLREFLETVLCPGERARAARFHFSCHRDRFIAARGILRCILSLYTGLPAPELVFTYGAQGKPQLAPGNGLQFSVSHSEHIALYAIARDRRVGIDVERERQDPQLAAIADRFFSPAEQAAINAVPLTERCRTFFTGWTRKESYVKALGGGLCVPLDRFDVSLCFDRPELLQDRGDRTAHEEWRLHNVDAPPGFLGSLCVEGRARVIQLNAWEQEQACNLPSAHGDRCENEDAS